MGEGVGFSLKLLSYGGFNKLKWMVFSKICNWGPLLFSAKEYTNLGIACTTSKNYKQLLMQASVHM